MYVYACQSVQTFMTYELYYDIRHESRSQIIAHKIYVILRKIQVLYNYDLFFHAI